MNAGRTVRPPGRHRTPRPLLPVTLSWVFYLPDPTRRSPGWAGGRASPPCAPTWTPFFPGPTLRPHLLPRGTISAISSPTTGQAGPGPPSGLCVPLSPPPRGAGLRGDQASWLFMKNPEPHLGACPTLPGAPHSALSPLGPGTAVAGPTQDQGAWASPLSQLLGRGDGASPHHTCGCSHIPLSIPGKIKRQNCTRAGCSLQKEPPLPRAWEPGVCVCGGEGAGEWGLGGGVEGGEARSHSPFGESVVTWASWAEGIRPPGGHRRT